MKMMKRRLWYKSFYINKVCVSFETDGKEVEALLKVLKKAENSVFQEAVQKLYGSTSPEQSSKRHFLSSLGGRRRTKEKVPTASDMVKIFFSSIL